MKRKSMRKAALPFIAACMPLAACNPSTTTSTTTFPTAIAVAQYTPGGALDTTNFAAGKGIAVTDFEPGLNDYALATVLSGGKILVAGASGQTQSSGAARLLVAVLRYNSNGTLDTSFGTGGSVRTALGGDHGEGDAIAVQADGKIVVAASIFSSDFTGKGIALVRYTALGALDTTFGGGGNGIVTAPIIGDASDTTAAALAVQPAPLPADQKIIVAGHGNINGRVNVVLLRYNLDGTLDTTFGPLHTGLVTQDLGHDAMALGMLLQPDGKIVVAGSVVSASGTLDTVVLRYNSDGSLDTAGFGAGNGFVITDAGGNDFANSVALQSDGKIVVAGHANVIPNQTSDISVLRYNSSGTLDMTGFGAQGKVIDDLGGFEGAFSVALQANGKIVVSGSATNSAGGSMVAVLRYNTDGSRDAGFGSSGLVTTAPIGPSIVSSGNAVALLPADAGIVVVGFD